MRAVSCTMVLIVSQRAARGPNESAGSPHHWHHCGRGSHLNRADHLEAVALVQRDVSLVRGLEVGDGVLAIAALERAPHQRGAVALPLKRGIDADERQVPMWLVRVILAHLLEYAKQIAAPIGR